MDLDDLTPNLTSKQINAVMRKTFGFGVNLSKMTPIKAIAIVENLKAKTRLIESRLGVKSFKDTDFNKYQMTLKVLTQYIKESKNHKRLLRENEMKSAELALAAKDMVDRIQKMVQDLGEMVNEDLPPLVDAVRDSIDSAVSDQFNTSMSAVLNTALENVRTAREGADSAARILLGESPVETMGDDGDSSGGEFDFDLDDDDDEDFRDDFESSDAAVGGEEPLGRSKRFQ